MFSPKTSAKLCIPAVNYGLKDPKRTDMVDLIKNGLVEKNVLIIENEGARFTIQKPLQVVLVS